ncbi:hypothetical protein BJ983_000176 [Actinomycetospora corticicola]|uniref:Uncharacterized protein n=1 Tax=Actinomycetospora corticicola TaxID=663602 RepID=A0A7Y9J3W4_9PSEU|nr:hypothetical protein [Actinomycetospora corticicola]
MTRPTEVLIPALLTSRLHVDLLLVCSSACRP